MKKEFFSPSVGKGIFSKHLTWETAFKAEKDMTKSVTYKIMNKTDAATLTPIKIVSIKSRSLQDVLGSSFPDIWALCWHFAFERAHPKLSTAWLRKNEPEITSRVNTLPMSFRTSLVLVLTTSLFLAYQSPTARDPSKPNSNAKSETELKFFLKCR